jgi:glycosyltransferase involved in cell wall biosynthesis
MSTPRITIVTPSFNKRAYIEETIDSVLSQGYPNLEYIIIDGGSTDGSVEIIRKHERWLAYWVSEKDRGQYHAINKGFARSTGEIMAWINADDVYCPWALHTAASIFSDLPLVEWLTTLTLLGMDQSHRTTFAVSSPGYAKNWFFRGLNLANRPAFKQWIQQESTFWRRSLWQKAGAFVDESFHLAGDFELWARFWQHSEFAGTATPLGIFRIHGDQKTAELSKYYQEAQIVLDRYNGRSLWKALRNRMDHRLAHFPRLLAWWTRSTVQHVEMRNGTWSLRPRRCS